MDENFVTDQKFLSEIYKIVTQLFSEEELKTLCFHLGVEYDSLPSIGKSNKVRELVLELNRQGNLHKLKQEVLRERPHISWPTMSDNNYSQEVRARVVEKKAQKLWFYFLLNSKKELLIATGLILLVIVSLISWNIFQKNNNSNLKPLTVLGVESKMYEFGSSLFTIIDLKLENTNDLPVRITDITLEVERSFQFDGPRPPQFRVPVSAIYHTSLVNLFEGDSKNLSVFHEIPSGQSERIAITVGSSGFVEQEDGTYQRQDPSYLSRVRIFLKSGDQVIAETNSIDLLVVAQDSGMEESFSTENTQLKIEADSLATMTTNEIRQNLQQLNVQVPSWLENND